MARALSLKHKILMARLALTVERLWPALIPVIGVINVFVAYGLYDGPSAVVWWVHSLILVGFLSTVLYLLLRIKPWRHIPSRDQAARRLERDSGVKHQPLSTLDDKPAQAIGLSLWRRHQERMAHLTHSLAPRWPQMSMLTSDPWGLRYWAFMPLIFGLMVGGPDIGSRMDRLITPDLQPGDGFSAWIAPPESTHLPPFVLDASKAGPLFVPSGSTLKATVPEGWGRASLKLDDATTDFDGDQDQHIQAVITQAHQLQIRRYFHALGRWTLDVIPDSPPVVAFIRPPNAQDKKTGVRVGVEAQDDYGLSKVWLTITPTLGDAVEIELPLSKGVLRATKIESRIDTDMGSLAGQSVTITPMARDSANQETTGEAAQLVWPSKPYGDATAKLLSQLRQALMQDPTKAPEIAKLLEQLSEQTDDISSALDLDLAKRDLQQDTPNAAEAQALMLDAANKMEAKAADKVKQRLKDLSDKIDQAKKNADKKALKDLAQKYADMLDKLLEDKGEDQPSVALNQDEMDQVSKDLDELAQSEPELREKLEKLAQKMAQKSDKLGQGQSDPFGNQPGGQHRGGRAIGDDQSTKVPDKNDSQGLGPLLEDIRSRIMDGNRSKAERDYLKRLLDIP